MTHESLNLMCMQVGQGFPFRISVTRKYSTLHDLPIQRVKIIIYIWYRRPSLPINLLKSNYERIGCVEWLYIVALYMQWWGFILISKYWYLPTWVLLWLCIETQPSGSIELSCTNKHVFLWEQVNSFTFEVSTSLHCSGGEQEAVIKLLKSLNFDVLKVLSYYH